ncbi:MAG TPA: hypothetical protein VMW69_16600 [Spirochaetia bacterium]|nr:hypothetical protein [Spirochaetia bacterium]
MTVRSNPRIILLFLIILALFVVSVLGFIFLTALYGIIFLAVALFLSFQFVRFAISHIRSHLRTDDEGISFHMPTNEEEHFDWGELTHSGFCTPAKGRPFAFVYSQERDRLITIPKEYEEFDALLGELQARVVFTNFELPPDTTIQAKLREILGIPDPSETTETDVEKEGGDDLTEANGRIE